ncbi:Fe-S oxidoreductase [hydrothermal vent metagenome]|uniref:Fe-S oxidoreductase n=1 Tax=hydrothermal vent metagenome TaxID=652676 RepID=A0A3B1BJW9_9ZZZZ
MRFAIYYLVPSKKTCGVIYNEGVAVLSALIKAKGDEVSFFRLDLDDFKRGVNIDFNADVHAISFASQQFSLARRLLNILKMRAKGIVIAGGVHATVARESIIALDGVDAVVSGEGEPFINWLLANSEKPLSTCDIKNTHISGTGARPLERADYVDINKLPFPDRTIFDKSLLRRAPEFVLSRGCPFSCSYCVNEFYNREFGFKIRKKTPSYCIEEFDSTFSNIDIEQSKIITFHDDDFLTNIKWLEEFGDSYRKSFRNPFRCNASAVLVTEEKVRLLKEMNCEEVWVGIECGDENYRRNALKKNVSDKKIYRAFELLKKYGLRGVSFNIYGLPGETWSGIYKTVQINRKAKVYLASATAFIPFPGTSLYESVKADGTLKHFTEEEDNKGLNTPGVSNTLSKQECINAITLLNASVNLRNTLLYWFYIFYFRMPFIIKRELVGFIPILKKLDNPHAIDFDRSEKK